MDRYEISVIVELDAANEDDAINILNSILFLAIDSGLTPELDWQSFGAIKR